LANLFLITPRARWEKAQLREQPDQRFGARSLHTAITVSTRASRPAINAGHKRLVNS
jgi:hypothetical protein